MVVSVALMGASLLLTPYARAVAVDSSVVMEHSTAAEAKSGASTTTQKAPNAKTVKKTAAKRNAKRRVYKRRNQLPNSVATKTGLRTTPDRLALSSSVAYMIDQDTGEVLFEKNADVTLPIASVTKLMTVLVIAQSDLPMNQRLRVTREDYVRSRARSRLTSGMVVTRADAVKAALMSSDNRAAHLLGRTYPGGIKAMVAAMNAKAESLGMENTRFADPTGLSDENVSTAHDLALLASALCAYPEICKASVQPVAQIRAGRRQVKLKTTNRLIGDPRWSVGLQKTGQTTAAGRCMVVQTTVADRRVVMVVLDSLSNGRRADDMLRMRRLVEDETEFEKQFAQVTPYRLL